MAEYTNCNGELFIVDEVDSVPRKYRGKWDFLYDLIESMKYGDKPLRIRLNSIKDVLSARVTISRIVKNLPHGYIIKTIARPVDVTKKDGEYFLFLYLLSVSDS